MKAALTALGLVLAPAALAQEPPPATDIAADKMAIALLPAKAKLEVSSPAFQNGGDMPRDATQYGKNVFPGLSWSKGPASTRSYVIVMQDADAIRNADAILHWTLFDIPAGLTTLDPGMTAPPADAMYGPNIGGSMQPWRGPRPFPGPKHRYPIQVFALDTLIPADPQMTFAALKAAMRGHVLASGQLVGLGSYYPGATPPPQPAPPQPAR
jgi:para-nitrobenzyl esterase